jgi:ferric-dicitrate binding protein FerR (iron transport regulator)
MRDTTPYHSPLLIHRLPASRRRRLSRRRALALASIAAIAACGVLLQQRGGHHTQLASANEPCTYFPG